MGKIRAVCDRLPGYRAAVLTLRAADLTDPAHGRVVARHGGESRRFDQLDGLIEGILRDGVTKQDLRQHGHASRWVAAGSRRPGAGRPDGARGTTQSWHAAGLPRRCGARPACRSPRQVCIGEGKSLRPGDLERDPSLLAGGLRRGSRHHLGRRIDAVYRPTGSDSGRQGDGQLARPATGIQKTVTRLRSQRLTNGDPQRRLVWPQKIIEKSYHLAHRIGRS